MEKQKRILVVDDESDMVDIVKLNLELQGYHVLSAMDGQEGLRMVKEQQPDLILLDVMMPQMNGYQVCRLLKFDDQYKHIPIILLTARARTEDRKEAQAVGADSFITKPFSMSDLLTKVGDLLGDHGSA